MPQSLSKIILHVIFSTKNRDAIIPRDVQKSLHAYIASICRKIGSEAYRVGGTDNHIHIACTLPRTLPLSKLLEEVKKSSSKWIKEVSADCENFAWQSGYAVFSVGQSQIRGLIRYINNQKEHHRKRTYREEVLEFLHKYEVTYDERYLWD